MELAFVLGRDLAGGALEVDDVLDAAEYVTPAAEIIAARTYQRPNPPPPPDGWPSVSTEA